MREKNKFNLEIIKNKFFKKELENYLEYIFTLKLNIQGILLFGSLAKGSAKNNDQYESDIDLIIICDDLPNDYKKRKQIIRNFTRQINTRVQAIWWTSKELIINVNSKYYLILDALDDGKIIYDPTGLINELKEKLFKELKEKGVIKTDLYWQWPLKKFGDKIQY
ncbi:MAG: nucleotidyltransferase domain-containing protein [Promethearchaeota archaeon]